MRLSRALLVMLLLHVVAIGGFVSASVLREKDLQRNPGDASSAVEAEDARVPAKGEAGGAAKRVPSTTTNRPGVHVVRPGETLTLIANENGVTLEALVAANGTEMVTNGLRAGQELKLPDKSPDPVTAQQNDSTSNALSLIEGRPKAALALSTRAIPARTSQPATDTGKVYVVGKGDSAYSIAQKNKVTPEALLKLNGIDDPKKIRPGQKLRLPSIPVKAKGKQS